VADDLVTNDHYALAKVINPGHDEGQCEQYPCEECLCRAVSALHWLSTQGRLLPAAAEKRTEWTVRFHGANGTRRVVAQHGGIFPTRAHATRYVGMQSMFPPEKYPTVAYLHREVLTGPWTEETLS
jgi:hypothetical protein